MSLTGALSPKEERVLQQLYFFQDSIVRHFYNEEVTKEIAIQYHDLSKYIQNKVKSLTELPQVKLTALTYLILEINMLIDTGKYMDISIAEIEKEIEKGTVLEFIAKRGEGDIDLSIIIQTNTFPYFKEFYAEKLQSIYGAYAGNERRKWGVQNSGLCLLLAVCRRTNW